MTTPSRLLAAASSLAVIALAGCSFEFSIGGASAEPEEIESVIIAELARLVPDAPTPSIDCGSESIDVEVGATHVCALTVTGDSNVYDVDVTITEVDGSEFRFDFEVAEEPR